MESVVDEKEVIENARMEGWVDGRTEGIKTTARNFRLEGLPIDMVAKATGLSIEEVRTLLEE